VVAVVGPLFVSKNSVMLLPGSAVAVAVIVPGFLAVTLMVMMVPCPGPSSPEQSVSSEVAVLTPCMQVKPAVVL